MCYLFHQVATPNWIAVCVYGFIMWVTRDAISQIGLRNGGKSIISLRIQEGNLECAKADGRFYPVTLCPSTIVSPWFTVLTVRRSDQSGSLKDLWMMDFIYLTKDNCDQEVLRKLRVLIRLQGI